MPFLGKVFLLIFDLITGVGSALFTLSQRNVSTDETVTQSRIKWKRRIGVILTLSTLVPAIVAIFIIEIPTPEIYTTTGDSYSNNAVYIKSDWLLQVYYTLVPYDDPQENGLKYEDAIPIETSVSVSAKTCFLGFRWSATESKDIVLTSDGNLNIIETDEPGTSIGEITATLNNRQLFPGDELKKDAFTVKGITIAGNSVPISDFTFSPNNISEGQNRIIVTYQDLECEILYSAHYPQLVSLQAQYTGPALVEGDDILVEDFNVVGTYEDGGQVELTDFSVEPSIANREGNLTVKVSKDGISTQVGIYVEPIPTNSLKCIEQHTPNDALHWVSITHWSNTDDFDINSKRYSGGLKVELNEMLSSLGSTVGSPLKAQIILTNDNGKPLVGNIPFTIVLDQSMYESKSSGTISIFVDGNELHNTGEIDGSTKEVFRFDIDADGADSIVIQADVVLKGGAFVFGIVDE